MKSFELREGVPEDVGMDPARIRRLRDLVGGWVKSGDHPSVVVLVARRGVIVLHEAFGVLRHGDTTPTLKRDSIFPVSSCTKPITAAAVMCLVEDGLIGLNRPFIEYVPELDVRGVEWLAEARVADLLCHTAGFDDLRAGSFHRSGRPARAGIAPACIRAASGTEQEDTPRCWRSIDAPPRHRDDLFEFRLPAVG